MIVYIVTGHTGEYDDRWEWKAKAFTSKEKADNLCGALNVLVKESKGLDYEDRDKLMESIQESLDPMCSIDYTGTYYKVEELEVDNE
jgi:hypothetical protein